MKVFKKTALLLIFLLCLLGIGGSVFAAGALEPLTLKTGGPGNTVHTIKSWDALKKECFGNGDTIELQIGSPNGRPKSIIVPETLTSLKLSGEWTCALVLESDTTLTLEDGFVTAGGITAQKSLTLTAAGVTVIGGFGTPLVVEGPGLTIDGIGIIDFTSADGDAMVSGNYTTLHHKSAVVTSENPYIPLFCASGDLTFINDGGTLAYGGIYAYGALKTTVNSGILDFSQSETNLESAVNQSELTVNNSYIHGSNSGGYGLCVDSITINGGNIDATLKCPPPDGLIYYRFMTLPIDGIYPALVPADIYSDQGEHRPALLDANGCITSYFPEGVWHVSIGGRDAGSFTINLEHPPSLHAVQLRLNAMQNGDTLDLRKLEENDEVAVLQLPEGLTDFTLLGTPDNPVSLGFEATPGAAVTITLQDVTLSENSGALFQNVGDATFILEGTSILRRPLLSTVGGHVRMTGSGTLQQPASSKNQAIVTAGGDTCLDIEAGTYTLEQRLMTGSSDVSLGYEQKGGDLWHKGDTFIQSSGTSEGDLTVTITGGTLSSNGSGKAFTSSGTVIYKQSAGRVQGSGLLDGDIIQFAVIDGELSLSADNAINGHTVNAYIGGGVVTIDGRDAFAISSDTGGAYIQRGGTLITQSTHSDQTLNLESHSIQGGSIFATFKEPIEEGKEVLYEVHNPDGTLAASTDVIVRGPISFEARTSAAGLLHMYLPSGSYQVLQGDTLLGTFNADTNTIVITSWQQMDSLLSNTDGQGLRDDDIIDISAMSGDTSGVYNIALPAWISRAHFVGNPGQFINARFSLASGRSTPVSLTIENLYLRPEEGHVIDIAQPAPIGSTLILAGDNSLQASKDVTAAGIHVDDVTWQQSDEWFESHPDNGERVLKALTIDAQTDDFGTMPTLQVNCSSSLGAAIGGGMYECAGDITIKNGNIQAIAGEGAAIGGGSKYGAGGQIAIQGGCITAESTNGVPIGGGSNSDGGNIQIDGATVSCISQNTESDGTLVGSLGYARGFSTFGPYADKDNIISEATVSVKSCNLRSYNHETTEEASIAAAGKDLANGKIKITFTDSNNMPLSDYGLIIRNVDTGEETARIRTWRADGNGSAGLVYTYLPDGNYRFESASEPGRIATSIRYPDGVLSAGGYVPTEGIVLKFD
ncbi:hypothetical protein [Eubacterium sp. 1001713B170207_170306_E7]|uniref:hypothetical protein n=1 Tax=Eubacterium sp. 1001713B170207_170306_E7 TaxID=2787097 RepID=UPI0018970E26|nr:hypothetical protein [Eubacterium sp. 1001713B170207_170306_E7]